MGGGGGGGDKKLSKSVSAILRLKKENPTAVKLGGGGFGHNVTTIRKRPLFAASLTSKVINIKAIGLN